MIMTVRSGPMAVGEKREETQLPRTRRCVNIVTFKVLIVIVMVIMIPAIIIIIYQLPKFTGVVSILLSIVKHSSVSRRSAIHNQVSIIRPCVIKRGLNFPQYNEWHWLLGQRKLKEEAHLRALYILHIIL